MENEKSVMYMYSNAFLKCDCGENLVLAQKIATNRKYSGDCNKCGVKIELLDGKFRVFSNLK